VSIYSQEIGFAAGTLIATPIGVAGVVTPVRFGILQDVSLTMTADLKELYGQNRYAIALAPGKTKIELNAKFAQINGALFNGVYFGASQAAAQTLFADSEPQSVPTVSAYTVAATNHSVYANDQGVFYQATGQPLLAVTALSAAGQYEVNNAGTYTFGSADAGAIVDLSYTYTSAAGVQLTIANPKMGVGPAFSILLSQAYDGRQANFLFNVCQASKLSFPTKQDDFTISEIDFMVAANASGIIGTLNTSL
jgi:hypothetical protein